MDIKIVEDQMKKVIENLTQTLSSVRVGRAHVSLVENIKVEYYGAMTLLPQVASVGVLDVKTLEIKPWDKEALKPIEQAILKSDIGITPLNDGKVLRLIMPTLTTERKKEIIKVMRKDSEEFKVAIRNVRRDHVEIAKKSEKDKAISQDDLRRTEQEIQKVTDLFIKKVDDVITLKEKEILEV